MSNRFYVLAVLAALSAAQARAADEPAAYLVAAQDGTPVTTASGACVRTSQWSTEASYRECDPRPIVAGMKVVESKPGSEAFRLSMNTLFDFDSATALHADDQEIRAATRATVAEAARQGLLRSDDINLVQIAGRALVYGFARMQIDGHFARWGISEAGAERMAEAVVDLFIGGISKQQT